jgi:hypothetical protein
MWDRFGFLLDGIIMQHSHGGRFNIVPLPCLSCSDKEQQKEPSNRETTTDQKIKCTHAASIFSDASKVLGG